MFGSLIDYLYVMFESRDGKIPEDVNNIQTNGEDSENWICFLPESISKFSYTRDRIFSRRNYDAY